MNKELLEALPASVKRYEKHFFVSTGRNDWVPRLEAADDAAGEFVRRVDSLSGKLKVSAKATAFHDPAGGDRPRILCFPDLLEYRPAPEEYGEWLHFYLSGGRADERFAPRLLSGRWLFVCIHASRDERCGGCGPPLLEALREEVAKDPAMSNCHLYGCSHTGGHKFAGNVLVYPEGDWYGLLEAGMSKTLIEHLRQGKILRSHWRGRAGLAPAEQALIVD